MNLPNQLVPISNKALTAFSVFSTIGTATWVSLSNMVDPKTANNPLGSTIALAIGVSAAVTLSGAASFILKGAQDTVFAWMEATRNEKWLVEHGIDVEELKKRRKAEAGKNVGESLEEIQKREGPGFHVLPKGYNTYLADAETIVGREIEGQGNIAIQDNYEEDPNDRQFDYRKVKGEPSHYLVDPEIPKYVSVNSMIKMGRKVFRGERKLTYNVWAVGKDKTFLRRSQFEPLIIWMNDEGFIQHKEGSKSYEWTGEGFRWLGKLMDAYNPKTNGVIISPSRKKSLWGRK